MSKGIRYPSHDILDRYLAIRDIPEYYEGIEIEEVKNLIGRGKIHYAEFKDPKGYKRIPHVDMRDVLICFGKDPVIVHPKIDRGVPFE